jgi:membrane protease YdiL (CAAX protease family)
METQSSIDQSCEIPAADRVSCRPPFGDENLEQTKAQSAKPWGLIGTFGWSCIIVFAYFLAAVFAVGFVAKTGLAPLSNLQANGHARNGIYFAVGSAFASLVAIAVCFNAVWIRRGMRANDYLGLHWPKPFVASRWIGAFVAYMIILEIALNVFGQRISSGGIVQLFATAGAVKPLLWISMVVIGPAMEELCFRGFLFTGLNHSFLRGPGAIVITSILFTLCHDQRDSLNLMETSAIGFFLAITRLETNSVPLCIFFHSSVNFVLMLLQMNAR